MFHAWKGTWERGGVGEEDVRSQFTTLPTILNPNQQTLSRIGNGSPVTIWKPGFDDYADIRSARRTW